MPYYTRLGLMPRKRHVQFRRPDGCLYSEELFGTEGFTGPSSTMYHIHPPTQVYGWKPEYSTKVEYVERDIMRMRHLKSAPMKPNGDFVTGRVVLFGNVDVEMAVGNPAEQMPYHFKNGQGDECFFIHFGSGTCHTMLGTLKFGPRDYLVIPKGVIYKLIWDNAPPPQMPASMRNAPNADQSRKLFELFSQPGGVTKDEVLRSMTRISGVNEGQPYDAKNFAGSLREHKRYGVTVQELSPGRWGIPQSDWRPAGAPENWTHESMPFGRYLLIETTNGSHIGPPPGYVSKKTSQFLEHAPYCERDLKLPEFPLTWDEKGDGGGFEVRIKARDQVHSYTYHYNPLDVVGWDGCYYPFIFNAGDFSPITGMLHMPPPIHQTFEAHNFVICTFAPRMLDYHPQAIKVPYNHSNLDSDEVLYYVEGNFGSRKGIEVGSLTLHPQGIPHGPHPGTVEASLSATFTSELAVMCDTFRPLFPTKAALDMDDRNYPASWQGEHFPGLASGKLHLNGAPGGAPGRVEVFEHKVVANVWAP